MKRLLLLLLLLPQTTMACGETAAVVPDAGLADVFSYPPLPAIQSCRFPGTAPGLVPRVDLVDAFELDVQNPLTMIPVPGTDDLLVVTLAGSLLRFPLTDPDSAQPILEIGRRIYGVVPAGEMVSVPEGSLGLFVLYEVREARLRLSFFTLADEMNETVVYEVDTPLGGSLLRAGETSLYVGVGDVVLEPTSMSLADDPTAAQGGMLRVDVAEPGLGISIPEDNPYLDPDGVRTATWATGLRSPRSCTTDSETDRVYCVDRGQTSHEINRIDRRRDYGWPVADGRDCVSTSRRCELGDVGSALVARQEMGDCELVGGRVYRGSQSASLAGVYVYGESCSGEIRAFLTRSLGFSRHEQQVFDAGEPISGFGHDAAGEVYVLAKSGRVSRVVAVPELEPFPENFSESGCFTPGAAPGPVPGVIRYELNSPLWSDGSVKDRFFALPAGEQIHRTEEGIWEFPPGSIIIKNFSFLMDDADLESERLVETRVLRLGPYQWEAHTYRWNEAGDDAVLLEATDKIDLNVIRDGEATIQTHTFPDRFSCGVCHGTRDPVPIGPRTDQLSVALAGENQVTLMDRLGLFDEPVVGDLNPLPTPSDEEAPIEDRARAYLDANCGHCHRPGGWVPSSLEMDLRYSATSAEMNVCNVTSQFRSEDRVRPGFPEDSLIFQRMETRGIEQMPPLATDLVDPVGVAVVGEWIRDLRECPETD